MGKIKVAIVSSGYPLESILTAIDLDKIELCALFGLWNEMTDSAKNAFKPIFQPLDMLSVNCDKVGADYFLVNLNQSLDVPIIKKIMSKGIDKDNIIGMWPFGILAQFNYKYYAQWNYLLNNQSKIKVDFIITGNSFFKYGIDIETMQPFNGINLARDSQDIYYSFKMFQAYLDIVRNNQYPKFCLIGLAPYVFNDWLDRTIRNFDQQFYFPIIGHGQMEYQGTERGNFLKIIFKSKYKSWFKSYLKQENEINFNDLDGSRQWHQDHNSITAMQRLNAADGLAIYEHKKYPETIERNKDILTKYIEMCLNHNVKPIGVLLPFSQIGHKHYPQGALREFFDILSPFLEKMQFINLWDMKLPDSYFEDITHLKIKGAIEVTKVIRECVYQILNN